MVVADQLRPRVCGFRISCYTFFVLKTRKTREKTLISVNVCKRFYDFVFSDGAFTIRGDFVQYPCGFGEHVF